MKIIINYDKKKGVVTEIKYDEPEELVRNMLTRVLKKALLTVSRSRLFGLDKAGIVYAGGKEKHADKQSKSRNSEFRTGTETKPELRSGFQSGPVKKAG